MEEGLLEQDALAGIDHHTVVEVVRLPLHALVARRISINRWAIDTERMVHTRWENDYGEVVDFVVDHGVDAENNQLWLTAKAMVCKRIIPKNWDLPTIVEGLELGRLYRRVLPQESTSEARATLSAQFAATIAEEAFHTFRTIVGKEFPPVDMKFNFGVAAKAVAGEDPPITTINHLWARVQCRVMPSEIANPELAAQCQRHPDTGLYQQIDI